MSKYTEAQKNATMRYQKEHLEQINIRVRKGCKQKYLDAAAARGQSLAQFMTDAADAAIERSGNQSTEPEIPAAPEPKALAEDPETAAQRPESKAKAAAPPDPGEVDLQRLLTDMLYQLDIIDIYGKDAAQQLLDLARHQNLIK